METLRPSQNSPIANFNFPNTLPTFATSIQDAMTENSVTYRDMLYNAVSREKTIQEQAALEKFYNERWSVEESDGMNAFQRFGKGWASSNLQEEIYTLSDKMRQANLIKDTKEAEKLQKEIAKLQFKLEQLPKPDETDWTSAYNLGSGLSSMADALMLEIGWWAGETAAAAAVGAAATPYLGGAGGVVTGGAAAVAQGLYRARRIFKLASTGARMAAQWERMRKIESGQMYNDLLGRTDLTEDQKQAMALAYGRSSATVELAGWHLGAGGLLVRGGKALGGKALSRIPAIDKWVHTQSLKAGVKEAVGATAKTPVQRLVSAGKKGAEVGAKLAASSAAESVEEAYQAGMQISTLQQGEEGETPTVGSVLAGGFEKMAGVPAELVKGKLSDESIAILEAFGSAILPSLVAGGAGLTLTNVFGDRPISPESTGGPSQYDINNSSLPKVIATAEKTLKKVQAVIDFVSQTKDVEYMRQMVANSELEGTVFAAPEDIEMVMALGEMSPSVKNVLESTGVASAIRKGRKTGTVEIPMQAFAEFVASEEVAESGVLPEVAKSVTLSSSEQSYKSVDRKIRAKFSKDKAKKVKEEASPKVQQHITGLRRQLSQARFAPEEVDAAIDVYSAWLATVEEASNGAVTVDELIDKFSFDIERRKFDMSAKDTDKILSKITGDRRRTLGLYRVSKTKDTGRGLKHSFYSKIKKGGYTPDEIGSDLFDVFDEGVGMRGYKHIFVAQHADITTFEHEVTHFGTIALIEMYNDGTISEVWRKIIEKIYDYFSQIPAAKGKTAMHKDRKGRIILEHEAHETLATGFQRYIEEGKASTPSLEKLYAYIKDIAAPIWEALSRGYFRDRTLSKTQIEFYDAVMQGHIDILGAEYKYGYAPLEKLPGVDDDEYELYRLERKLSRARSSNSMFAAMRKMVKDRESERWKEIYREAEDEAKKRLAGAPEYVLIKTILDNGKLNKEAMAKATRLASKIPAKYFALVPGEGLTPEQLVAEFGPEMNILDMAKILISTPDIDVAARRQAKTEADTRYLQETDPVSDVDPANAMRTLLFVRSLVKESMMIKGQPLSDFAGHYKEWIESAEKYVMDLTLNNAVDLPKWGDLESRITDDYITALTTGDTFTASLKADQRAMVNYVLVRSKQIKKMQNAFKRRFDKFRYMPTSQDLKTLDGVTWNLIHTIMQEYGFTTRRGRINASAYDQYNTWLSERRGIKFFPTSDFEAEAEILLNPPKRTSMTVEEFARMFALVEKIRAIGEAETKVFWGEKQRRLDVVVGEIITNIDKMRKARGDKAFEPYKKGSLDYFITPPLGMLEPLFGDLGMRELWMQLRDALVARDSLGDIVRNMIADSFEKNNIGALINDKRKFDVAGWEVDNSVLLFALQHSGNEHNRENAIVTLQQYYKNDSFSETDYEEFLNATPAAMRAYVNDLWAMFGFLKRQIDEQTRQATGGIVGTVPAKPYTMRDGTEMSGGYFPAPKTQIQNKTIDTVEAYYDNNLFFPMTGFTKDRTKNKLGYLDMGISALNDHIFKAVNFATTQVAFNDIQVVLNNKELQNFLGRDAGTITGYIRDWVRTAIMPVTPKPTLLRAMQKLPTVIFLGFKASQGLVQLLGVLPAFTHVNTAELLKSSINVLNVPRYFKLDKEMGKRSAFMADRAKKFDSRYFGLMRDKTFFDKAVRKYGDGVVTAALTFVRTFQCMTDLIVWDASYNDSIKKGMSHEDARKQADVTVQKTQGDRTRMNEPAGFVDLLRFFQSFMSYTLTLRQMYRGAVLGRKYKTLGSLVALVVVSAVLESYLKENDREWRKKYLGKKARGTSKDFGRRVQNRAVAQIIGTFGDTIIPFGSVGSTALFELTAPSLKEALPGYRPYTAGATPVSEAVSKTAKAITLDKKTIESIYDTDMSLGANLIDFLL